MDAMDHIAALGPSCEGASWSQLEKQYRGARERISDQIERKWCGRCPALDWCAIWAEEEGYSGLAAGAVYKQGERRAELLSRVADRLRRCA